MAMMAMETATMLADDGSEEVVRVIELVVVDERELDPEEDRDPDEEDPEEDD